jgi:hypothetical protein
MIEVLFSVVASTMIVLAGSIVIADELFSVEEVKLTLFLIFTGMFEVALFVNDAKTTLFFSPAEILLVALVVDADTETLFLDAPAIDAVLLAVDAEIDIATLCPIVTEIAEVAAAV